MKIRPVGNRVVAKQLASEEKTKSGIVLPDTAKEMPQQAIVVAVGSGKVFDNGKVAEPEVAVGDKIIYKRYAENETKVDGEKYIISNQDDILGVIE